MKFLSQLLISYIPKVASVSLWVGFFLYDTELWIAIAVTIYALALYAVTYYQANHIFDGVIELKETEHGAKSFQLIVNKDPESFQDQDKVIFLFKNVS